MHDVREFVDPGFDMLPLEEALKVFADYRVGDIGYAEYATLTRNLLADEPVQRAVFEDVTTRFQGDLFVQAVETGPPTSSFSQMLREQEIIISRHWRYLPPLMEQHDFIEILYLYRGTATYLPDGREFRMQEGDLCIIAPNTRHNIFCHSDESVLLAFSMLPSAFNQSFLSVLSHDDILAEFFLQILYQQRREMSLVFRTGRDANIGAITMRMIEEYNRSGGGRIRLVGDWLRLMLSYALRDYGDSVLVFNWMRADMHAGIAPILSYMQAHYADATLKSAAKAFYFSEGYLSRLIRRGTGLTFSDLLRNIRMDRAMLMLRQVGSSPEQVMQAVGYNDLSYFSRRFQEYSGHTLAAFLETEDRKPDGRFPGDRRRPKQP